MIKLLLIPILIFFSSLSNASLVVSNLINDSFTQNNSTFVTGGGQLALGFLTGNKTVILDSITMRLKGSNFVAPVEASIPVDIYSSEFNGNYDIPGTLLGSLEELYVGALNEYSSVSEEQIILNSGTTYWAVLSTGSFEDLYAYQGGEIIGDGGIVSPSLRYQYNDTEWNQLTINTFAMEVEGTIVPLPASLPLFISAITLLFGNYFVQSRNISREQLA